MKRVFLIVLDSCGAGALPDADRFGDEGAHTLKSCHSSGKLQIPNLIRMGLGNIEGLEFLGACAHPSAAHGRMAERSAGKDTTTGHWEIAGLVCETPMPTYPEGFDDELLAQLSAHTGRGILCNKPYSGTQVIADYGDAHVKSGDLIVYTSADSVLQIAAHEQVVPLETLYEYCRIARQLSDVGRVIARPFVGTSGAYTRSENRRDFSLPPHRPTMLDDISAAGQSVIAIGKITDIFAGRGITRSVFTHNNKQGMQALDAVAGEDFTGLCFANLVDFDMLYGHRNDVAGYTTALNEFDEWLGDFLPKMKKDDMLIITADHGCDPGFPGTDHTREYVPLLLYGEGVSPGPVGGRDGFGDVAATVCNWLGVQTDAVGKVIQI